MKIGVLVGAAGLALAGVAFAEDAPANLRSSNDAPSATKQGTAKRLGDFSDFTRKRDAVLGANGSAKRGVVVDEMRALINAGIVDEKRSLINLNDGGDLRGMGAQPFIASRSSLSIGSGASGGSAGKDDFGQGATPAVFDGFETYVARDMALGLPTSFGTVLAPNGTIVNQTSPFGVTWTNRGTFTPDPLDPAIYLVVNANDAALPAGAPATDGAANPNGQMLGYLHSVTATVNQASTGVQVIDDDVWIPTATQDLVISFDWYNAGAIQTFIWVDLISAQEGFVSTRYFAAGFPNNNLGGFQGVGTDNPTDPSAPGVHPMLLGTLAGNFTIGEFYDNAVRIKADQWISVAQVMTASGQSMFHRTRGTDGTPLAMGGDGVLITDRAGTLAGPFVGLASGWTETYPGQPSTCLAGDCLATTPVSTYPVDGIAPVGNSTYAGTNIGLQQAGFGAPRDGNNAKQAPLLAASSHDMIIFRRFGDPDISVVTTFVANDVYFDNYQVTGSRFVQPEPIPDQVLPFVDDMERWSVAPIRVQAGASYFDALSSRAQVVASANSTVAPGSALPPKSNAGAPTQSISQSNEGFAAQNTFRTDFNTNYPNSLADPANSVPSVSSVMVRVSDTTNVRAVQTSGQTTLVLLGTENPTSGATDNRVYVRQPNFDVAGTKFAYAGAHAFDPTRPGSLTQNHWRSSVLFAAGTGFNDDNWNYEAQPQGAGTGTFTLTPLLNTFFEVRVEIPGDNPQNLADTDGNTLFPYNLFVNGVQLCPPDAGGLGDCVNQTWVANNNQHNNIAFLTGDSTSGIGNLFNVDDIRAAGKVRTRGTGPAFALPYVEDFEGYVVDPDSLGGQGPFDFLLEASLPDNNFFFFPDATAPTTGNFCRYMIDSYLSIGNEIPDPATGGTTTLPAGSTIAIPDDILPRLNPAAIGCPGSEVGTGAEATLITQATPDVSVGGTQVSRAKFVLLTPSGSTPAVAGDAMGFKFDQHKALRWNAGGADSVVVNAPAPTAANTANGLSLGAQTMRYVATSGSQDENSTNMFDRDQTQVPVSPDPTRPSWVSDFGQVQYDMYVQAQINPDVPGGATPFTAPLGRYSLQIQGDTANDRTNPLLIAEMRFGGPDLNPDSLVPASELALFFANPNFPSPPGQPAVPQFLFEDTGVAVPLNSWFRVGFRIDRTTGAFTWSIDTTPGENVFAAGTDAVVVTSPQNPGLTLAAGVTRIASLQFRDGRDEGSNGFRVPPKVMVQGARDLDAVNRPGDLSLLPLAGASPWNAAKPAAVSGTSDAAAGPSAWCVYEVNTVQTPAPTAPLVQAVDGVTGALGAVAVMAQQDLVAVFRRNPDRSFATGVVFDDFRFLSRQVADADIVDAPGANFDTPILPDCPSKFGNGSTNDGFIYLDDTGNEIMRGDWTLEGEPGQNGVNDPFPNGGIAHNSPPYNNGVGAPLPNGDPGNNNEGFRNILLSQFYMTPAVGADIEPQRIFVDNINVTEDCNTVGPANLLTLLANFSQFGPTGLLDLLANFGGKHPSCP